jgi:DNA-binding transcriptional LysR family regulator
VVAVPDGHPWAALEVVPVDELVRTPMVMRDPSANTRRTIEAALEARGLALAPPLAEVGSTSAAKATAISERAPVLLSRMAVRGNGEGLVERPVEGIDFARKFVILMGAHETLRPAARALIDHLVKTTG